jgi:hypothetical protein
MPWILYTNNKIYDHSCNKIPGQIIKRLSSLFIGIITVVCFFYMVAAQVQGVFFNFYVAENYKHANNNTTTV